MAINIEKSKVEKYTIVSINFTHPLSSNKVELISQWICI